jgi:hypothetical protein
VSTNAQIIFNILTIIALIAGPVAAIQTQEYLEKGREEKRRKLKIFRELMVTRSTALSPRHVEALNGIQMEFSSNNVEEKKVIDAWQLYINHLNHIDKNNVPVWSARSTDLLIDLLFQMATLFEFHDFNKARIKSEAYLPQYFADIENEQNELRKAAVKVFQGKQPLKVNVIEEAGPSLPSPYAPRRPS